MLVQELTAAECRETLARADFGRLACVADNQPYIVPVHFDVDGEHLYLFSMPGRKIEWMRANPHVCVEVDVVKSESEWESVVLLGRYEELVDTPAYRDIRGHAEKLLQTRPMWWEPATVSVSVASEVSHHQKSALPVFYRIAIDQMSGRRGTGERRATTTSTP